MSGSYDPRITAYFGDAVLQAGFMPLPHLFLRHYRSLGLSQVQAMFVLQLMEIAWDVGDPPNSVNKLAARMGLSQRSIRACSKEVYDLGLIEIYDQWDEAGAQVENAYDLGPLFRRLAALAPAHTPPGQLRTRRQRAALYDAPESAETELSIAAQSMNPPARMMQSTPMQKHASSPVQKRASSPLQDSASPPRARYRRGVRAETCSPPGNKRSATPRTSDHGTGAERIRA